MRTVLISVLVLFTVAAMWALIVYRAPLSRESDVRGRPSQVDDDSYITSDDCQACHPREYATWHRSYHRTMTQVASPETVIANFDGVQVNAVRGRAMKLQRQGPGFWAEFDDPDYLGIHGETRRINREVVLLTGSHQQQVYWYATGVHRLISKLPAIYLIAERQWIPRRAAFLHPPDEPNVSETGGWSAVCIACHTTDGKPKLDTPFGSKPVLKQRFDSTVGEFGIACEACHGPGQLHAQSNHNPMRRYWLHLTRQADPTIVQPLKLDPERSSEICGQCHSVWEFYDLRDERQANSNGLPYRPGDEMRDTRFVVQPTVNFGSDTMKQILASDPSFVRDSFWSDGMVRVSGREYNGLIDSPCYKNARYASETLSCFSCHTMHKKPDDKRSMQQWADSKQLSAGMEGNQACLQCHPKFSNNVTAHTKHTDASANLCYNCHMPYTSYGLLRALRSHQISSPDVARSISTGRPNACNQCHLDKTLKWTYDNLEKWYPNQNPRVKLTTEEATVSAAVLWLLRGDAGQRALMAWSMGWQPAQQASGNTWIAPILAQLLDDPYDAVRLISARSLRRLPRFADFDYNFLSPPAVRYGAVLNAINVWRDSMNRRTDGELLLDANGDINLDLVNHIKQERDDRRISLRE